MRCRCSTSVALLAAIVGATIADAQQAKLTVGPNVRASSTFPERRFGEVTACADPAESRHLIMAAMYDTSHSDGSQAQAVVVFASRDGGRTWASVLDSWDGTHSTPDPSCAITSSGSAYLATMTLTRQRGPIALYTSRDTGRTWSAPDMIGTGGYDRPWLAAGDSIRGRSMLYVSAFHETRAPFARDVATFRIADTTPSGVTATLQRSHYLHNGPLAILSDDLVVGILAHPTTHAQEPPSLPEPVGGWPPTPVVAAIRWDGDTGIAPPVTISTLASQTPSKRFLLTDFIPSLAMDRHSTAFRGRLYAVWLDAGTGALRVVLAYSTDSAKTWSTPRVVSDDGLGSTDDRPFDSVNPTVAVNDGGVAAVLWYDRRDNSDFGYWPRVAVSLDGGETWSASVRVSAHPMAARLDGLHTLVAPRQIDGEATEELAFEIHDGWNFRPGDTSGLVADAAGTFHAFWIDNRTGLPQVWTAPVRVDGTVRRMKDVTKSTTISLGRLQYDTVARRITVTATVNGVGRLDRPIVLQATSVMSNITDRISAIGTANGISGAGATWVVTSRDPSTTLEFVLGPWTHASLNPLVVTVRVLTPDDTLNGGSHTGSRDARDHALPGFRLSQVIPRGANGCDEFRANIRRPTRRARGARSTADGARHRLLAVRRLGRRLPRRPSHA
jgi:hypothetical protein